MIEHPSMDKRNWLLCFLCQSSTSDTLIKPSLNTRLKKTSSPCFVYQSCLACSPGSAFVHISTVALLPKHWIGNTCQPERHNAILIRRSIHCKSETHFFPCPCVWHWVYTTPTCSTMFWIQTRLIKSVSQSLCIVLSVICPGTRSSVSWFVFAHHWTDVWKQKYTLPACTYIAWTYTHFSIVPLPYLHKSWLFPFISDITCVWKCRSGAENMFLCSTCLSCSGKLKKPA